MLDVKSVLASRRFGQSFRKTSDGNWNVLLQFLCSLSWRLERAKSFSTDYCKLSHCATFFFTDIKAQSWLTKKYIWQRKQSLILPACIETIFFNVRWNLMIHTSVHSSLMAGQTSSRSRHIFLKHLFTGTSILKLRIRSAPCWFLSTGLPGSWETKGSLHKDCKFWSVQSEWRQLFGWYHAIRWEGNNVFWMVGKIPHGVQSKSYH